MKVFREIKWDALLTGVLYVILGLVSLVIPETMEKTIGYLIGSVLIVAGAVSMISYLLRDAHQNYYHNDFYHGLIAIGAGILVLVKVEVIVALIPFLLGIMILISGCSKLQDVIDMKRTEYGNWVVMLAFAAGNLLVGILLTAFPFESADLLFRLLGLGLIFSGITDCVITIYFAGKIRDYLDGLSGTGGVSEELRGNGAKARRKEGLSGQPKPGAERNPAVKTNPGTKPNPGAGSATAAGANSGAGANPVTGATLDARANPAAGATLGAGANPAAAQNPGTEPPSAAASNPAVESDSKQKG